ncbi:MAG: homoserine dehydrogenase, partial [Gemmatimonadetes bacterium]|nr:homoserine dehydrogenase [Gemmatimonadota bacterium]
MRTLRIDVGLVGCGTVGSAFAAALEDRGAAVEERYGVRLVLRQVAVTRPNRPRPHLRGARVHDDAPGLAGDSSLPIVVEASGAAAASSWLRVAHARGACVVTANKQAVANDPVLLDLLARHDPRLLCEAAAGAALPVVRVLRETLAAEDVLRLRGILNGTTTFVLTRLAQGVAFADAVREAQRAGFAEPDPSFDLDGRDAAAKLAILCTLAWRRSIAVEAISVAGIREGIGRTVTDVAARGARVRLVATASSAAAPGQAQATVAAVVLEPDDPLAAIDGAQSAVEIHASLAGRLFLT